jgi:hypothetical protein
MADDDWVVPQEPPQTQDDGDDWVVPDEQHAAPAQGEPESPLTTFARSAARSVASLPPTVAGASLAGMATAEFGPVVAIPAAFGGAVAGSIGGNKLIDWALDHFGLREGSGPLSAQAEQQGNEANPTANLLGSLVAAPVGFGSRLPAAMSAGAQLVQRGVGAAGMGGLDVGQQLLEKGPENFDWKEAIANAAAGGVFANPRSVTAKFSAAGERIGKPIGDLFKSSSPETPAAQQAADAQTPPGATPPADPGQGTERADVPTDQTNVDTSTPPLVAQGASELRPPPDAAQKTSPTDSPNIGNPDSAPVGGKDASPLSTDDAGRKYLNERDLADRQASAQSLDTGPIPQDFLAALQPSLDRNSMAADVSRAKQAETAAPKPNEPVFDEATRARAAQTGQEPPTGSVNGAHDPAEVRKTAEAVLQRAEQGGYPVDPDREAAIKRVSDHITQTAPPEPQIEQLMRQKADLERQLKGSDTAAVTNEPKVVQNAVAALHAVGKPELATGLLKLPIDEKIQWAARYMAAKTNRTGAMPETLANPRLRKAEHVATAEVGGKQVSFRSKAASAKATQALKAMKTAMDNHPPVEGETTQQMRERYSAAVAEATKLNGGNNPTDRKVGYSPQVKPAEWLWMKHAQEGAKSTMQQYGKRLQNMVADEKLLRGGPEDVEAYRANRRGDADIAKSRRSGDEAVQKASEKASLTGPIEDMSNHTPEAQDRMHEELGKVADNIVKYADSLHAEADTENAKRDNATRAQKLKYDQMSEEERSVASDKDVAAYRKGQSEKAGTPVVETKLSKPTLSLIKKIVADPKMPKVETPDLEKKYPEPCT